MLLKGNNAHGDFPLTSLRRQTWRPVQGNVNHIAVGLNPAFQRILQPDVHFEKAGFHLGSSPRPVFSGTCSTANWGLLTVIRHLRCSHYLGLPTGLLMAYLLPRTILVVIAWGITCVLIRRIWPSAEIAIFAVAGATWLAAAVAYFGYSNKLRHDIAQLERALGYTRTPSAFR
jgi:hypothetical protein